MSTYRCIGLAIVDQAGKILKNGFMRRQDMRTVAHSYKSEFEIEKVNHNVRCRIFSGAAGWAAGATAIGAA